jgi:starch synthase
LQGPDRVKPRLLYVASEVLGFAKTGGLADVAGSLPRALARRGFECAVILPLYRSVRTGKTAVEPTGHSVTVPIGNRAVTGSLWQATLPESTVPVYLVEQPDYFDRDDPADGRGLYQFALPDGRKRDYPDNSERFIFFARAVLESLPFLKFCPDLLHANDWQTGLIPVYLRETYRGRDNYSRIRTLFTVHNLAYQGLFWHWDMLLTGLDWRLFNYQQLEFYGQLNFLKAGIVFSDAISTVSPTYAKEIQTPYFGCGLEGVLAERRERLFGIVNGVDYQFWNPATDPHLVANYDETSVADRKPLCKAALQRRYGLAERPRTPLMGIVARLIEQKGLDLVGKAAESFLQQGAQLAVLGEGEPVLQRMLLNFRSRYPSQVGVTFGFDEALAHQIEAGADIFLMPSRYEPAGLNQLYSLKYGTVPIVRATGGLADTIVDYTPESVAAGKATGFTFIPYTPAAFLNAVERAISVYREETHNWLQLMKNGMGQDWSWDRIAGEYEKLYSIVIEND